MLGLVGVGGIGEPLIFAMNSYLKLKVGDKMVMEYDFGTGWEFEMELLSITEMKP